MPCKLLAAMSLIPLVAACVPLTQIQDDPPSQGQLSLVDQTCTQVMGLNRGEVYFAVCHDRLSDALATRDQGQAIKPVAIGLTGGHDTEAGRSFYAASPSVRWSRERYACAQIGLLPGTAAFDQCVAGLYGALLN